MRFMKSPLQKIRKETQKTLGEVAKDVVIHPSNLSRIERGLQQASPELAADICKLEYFAGKISEMEILYPERFINTEAA